MSSKSATVLGPDDTPPDLAAFKTPDTAQTVRVTDLGLLTPGRLGFLGVQTATNSYGRVTVLAVAPDSPAASAGLKPDDVILRLDGRRIASPEDLRQNLRDHAPRQFVKLSLLRGEQSLDVTARLSSLGAVGRPLDQIRLGVRTGEARPRGGIPIEVVEPDSTGARAGLKPGDVLLQINDHRLADNADLSDVLTEVPADDVAALTLSRDANELTLHARLAPADSPDRPAGFLGRRGFGPRGFGNRTNRTVLRLALIGIDYPDVKHNPRVSDADWEREFFSTNSFTDRNATGQTVHGSINDFYTEQSAGLLRVDGKMLGWIPLSRNRMAYSPARPAASGRGDDGIVFGGDQWTDQDTPLVGEVLNQLLAQQGPNALAGYDAVVFLYAGGPATHDDASVYWPHTTAATFQYRRLRYVMSFEGGQRMADISVLCHELGHVLGLPDLYVRRAQNPLAAANTKTPARPNPNPYVETLANWDLMSLQVGFGRPQHLSAWSKEQLGWLKPVVLDPSVPQDLVLGPVENSTNQCFKIPLRPDATEYLLLENRRRIGFDQSVPAEGLLIWRVVYNRPVLEEAHGFSGANAARVDIRRIPFPTDRNNSFTPFTKPSSAAFTGAELPLYLTDIRRLPDGRISFRISPGFD